MFWIASGVRGAAAYYRGPYVGGAVFLLLDGPVPASSPAPKPLTRILTVFPSFLGAIEVPDHRKAFVAYVRARGFKAEESDSTVIVRDGAAEAITASFDDRRRLTKLQG